MVARRGSSNGSVLVHVLIMALVMAMIAAAVLNMVMHRATVAAQTHGSVAAKAGADAAMSKAISFWASTPTQQACSTGGTIATTMSCSLSGGGCRCTFTDLPGVVLYANPVRACACAPKMEGDTCPAGMVTNFVDCR